MDAPAALAPAAAPPASSAAAPAPAASKVAPAPPASLAPTPVPKLAPAPKSRRKVPGQGPAAAKAATAARKAAPKARKKPAAAIADPPPVAHEVLDGMPAPSTSFMDLLQDAEVDLGAPPLQPFRVGDDLEEDEEEEGDDEEELTEIGEEAFAATGRVRSTNYTEAEDILLVRSWVAVGMDEGTGTDQTGKRYW